MLFTKRRPRNWLSGRDEIHLCPRNLQYVFGEAFGHAHGASHAPPRIRPPNATHLASQKTSLQSPLNMIRKPASTRRSGLCYVDRPFWDVPSECRLRAARLWLIFIPNKE